MSRITALDQGDTGLQLAAKAALAKINSVLPEKLKHQLETSSLLIAPSNLAPNNDEHFASLRKAIRKESAAVLGYLDANGQLSERTVLPLAIGYFDEVRVLVAWCKLRDDYRHFRVDRIQAIQLSNEPFKPSRGVLLKRWRLEHNIPEPPC